jgi:hypothetical protein
MKFKGYKIKQKGCHVTISKDGVQVFYLHCEQKLTRDEKETIVMYFLNRRAWGD